MTVPGAFGARPRACVTVVHGNTKIYINDPDMISSTLSQLGALSRPADRVEASTLAVAASRLLESASERLPGSKLRGLRDVEFHCRAMLNSDDRRFIQQLNAAYSLERHLAAPELLQRVDAICDSFKNMRTANEAACAPPSPPSSPTSAGWDEDVSENSVHLSARVEHLEAMTQKVISGIDLLLTRELAPHRYAIGDDSSRSVATEDYCPDLVDDSAAPDAVVGTPACADQSERDAATLIVRSAITRGLVRARHRHIAKWGKLAAGIHAANTPTVVMRVMMAMLQDMNATWAGHT